MPESEGKVKPEPDPEKAGSKEDQIKIVDGKGYRRVPSGYTVREFYSHDGPGWDFRQTALEGYGVDDPNDLPDDEHFSWEAVEEEDSQN